VTADNDNSTGVGIEDHYTPQRVAKTLNLHPRTVVRLFRGQPGGSSSAPTTAAQTQAQADAHFEVCAGGFSRNSPQ
jgi:hypothetical protein